MIHSDLAAFVEQLGSDHEANFTFYFRHLLHSYKLNSPNGVRTRVFGVRGRYPRPLDDGTAKKMAGGLGFEPR